MKKIIFIIVLFISLNSSAQNHQRDTVYCMIGFNATLDNESVFDGSCGMKCYTKILTLKEIEDEVKRQNKELRLKNIIILALTWMTSKQYYTLWGKSNNVLKTTLK